MTIFKSLIFPLLALAYFNNANADVLIDLEQTDEISISNTQPESTFTVRIAEKE